MRRHLVAAALLALASCSGGEKSTPLPDAGCTSADSGCATGGCVVDGDCGDARLYACLAGACVPACSAKADCTGHPAFPDGKWTGCETAACVCDVRRCVPASCSADSECAAGQICRAGSCGAPDFAADTCAITPDFAVLRKGATVVFTAAAYKNDKPALLGANAFVWAADDASIEKSGENGAFVGVAPSGEVKVAAIRATPKVSTSSCTASVLVLDTVPVGTRVVVVDEESGRLVAGAMVVINGIAAQSGSPAGVHTLGVPGTAALPVVSVFHPDYDYVTLVGALSSDLLVPLRRNRDGVKGGGFKGTFANFPSNDVAIGIAGLSSAGDATDLGLDALPGPGQQTSLVFGNKPFDPTIPSGVMLAIGGKRHKDGVQAWGTANTCPLDEAAVVSGSCGTRSAFGLMGTIPADALLPITSGAGPITAGTLLAAAAPHLKGFRSALVKNLGFRLKPAPTDGTSLLEDPEAFKTLNLAPEAALSLLQIVHLPDFPSGFGEAFDTAVLIAGSQVAGRGFVPLGLAGASDASAACGEACAKNGKAAGGDVVAEDPRKIAWHDDGKVTLRAAPNHAGLEGSPYLVLATASAAKGAFVNGAVASSSLVWSKAALTSGGEIDFGGRGFLGFPEAASYDYRASKVSGVGPVPGASLYRAIFESGEGKRWVVYFDRPGFDLPKPPAGLADRTMLDGKDRQSSPGSAGSPVEWTAMLAKDGPQAMGPTELFDFGAGRAMQLSKYLLGFSKLRNEPGLAFVAPSGKDCTGMGEARVCSVYDGNYVFKVKVSGLPVPAKAKLLFEANTGERLLVEAMGADWIAEAKFKTPLMMDEGTVHTVTVTMVTPESTEAQAVPIDPKVSTSLKVNVLN